MIHSKEKALGGKDSTLRSLAPGLTVSVQTIAFQLDCLSSRGACLWPCAMHVTPGASMLYSRDKNIRKNRSETPGSAPFPVDGLA